MNRRALASLCAGVAVSGTGDWLMFIALPLVVLGATGSPLATSTVFLAELVPAVVVGIVCGPLIDRRDPGRLLVVLTAAQGLVVLPLLWAGPHRVWLVYIVAAAQAAFTSLTSPAQQAVVPTLFASGDVARVNGMVIACANVARLVGSPLGGALLPVVGLHGLVIADIGSFVASAALLLPLVGHPHAVRPGSPRSGRMRTEMVGAIRMIRADRTLGAALAVAFLSAVAQGLFLVLFILFVLRSLHAGDGLVGLLRGVQAIGGVLGGLLVTTCLRGASARALAIGGLTAFALVSALSWNSPGLTTAAWWYVALFIAVGIPATALETGLITGTQQAGPAERRGRALSLLAVAEAIGQGGGIIAAGALSGAVSLTLLLNAQAGCYAACGVIAWAAFGAAPKTKRAGHIDARTG